MGLFNFSKKNADKKIITTEVENSIEKLKNKEPLMPSKKYNLLCINFGINDYAFTLTANNTGKIVVNKSMSRNEYIDLEKTNELISYIDDNFKKIKEFTTRVNKDSHQNNNMLQFEVDNQKYTLFRSDVEDELSLFYDRLLFDIANIFELDKSYESIELNFTFDYPNNWEIIPGDVSKYALLSSSTPLLVFNDNNKNIITFEYLKVRNNLIEQIISNIKDSEDYNVLSEFAIESDSTIESIIVDYKETNNIELFSFIEINDICIISTIIIDNKEEVKINDIMNNKKVKEMIKTLKSFKTLTSIE